MCQGLDQHISTPIYDPGMVQSVTIVEGVTCVGPALEIPAAKLYDLPLSPTLHQMLLSLQRKTSTPLTLIIGMYYSRVHRSVGVKTDQNLVPDVQIVLILVSLRQILRQT